LLILVQMGCCGLLLAGVGFVIHSYSWAAEAFQSMEPPL
jgi:hypothetical protein